jgi:hypothetical protein
MALLDALLTEGQTIDAVKNVVNRIPAQNITMHLLQDLQKAKLQFSDVFRSMPRTIFPDYLLPRLGDTSTLPSYLVHYETFIEDGTLWPVVVMPKGMCLFTARGMEVDGTRLDVNANYLYKLQGNPTLVDHRGNGAQDTQTYFYPHPHGVLNLLKSNLCSDTMVVLTRDVRLLCLISPSPLTRRNVAGASVKQIKSCTGKSYDRCMSDAFRMSMKLDGMIQIATSDAVSNYLSNPRNDQSTNLYRCAAMNNDLDKSISWLKTKEEFLGQPYVDFYKNNFGHGARVFGTPEIVLLPFDLFQPDAEEKYRECYDAFTQKVDTQQLGDELIHHFTDRFVFQLKSFINGTPNLTNDQHRAELSTKMTYFLNRQASYLLKSKQFFPIMTLWASNVDTEYKREFCLPFTTTSLPVDELYFINSYRNDGNPKKYQCAFETNYTKEVVYKMLYYHPSITNIVFLGGRATGPAKKTHHRPQKTARSTRQRKTVRRSRNIIPSMNFTNPQFETPQLYDHGNIAYAEVYGLPIVYA